MKRKKKFSKYILALCLFLTCFYFKAGAQNVHVEAKVDQTTIRIGDQTKLHLIVHQPVKEHVSFPKLADSITAKLVIVNGAKPDTVIDQNDKSVATIMQNYTITGFDAGTYTIPSYSFIKGRDTLKSNELTLYVQTVKVDTTKAIYDIKQPLAVSYTFLDWLKDNWPWVALGAVIIIGVIGLIWYFKKRPKKEIVVPEVKRVFVAPHTQALNKLKELNDKKLWQQDEVKQYYIELSDIIREYLEKRYVIKTHEKTTDEIFSGLKYMDISDENRGKLRQILVLSDLVKFAKEKPLPAENDESMLNATNFVLRTGQMEQPITTEGGNTNV